MHHKIDDDESSNKVTKYENRLQLWFELQRHALLIINIYEAFDTGYITKMRHLNTVSLYWLYSIPTYT